MVSVLLSLPLSLLQPTTVTASMATLVVRIRMIPLV